MAMSDLEDAIRAWVKTATGYDDAHVFFADQKPDRPAGPYITIRLDLATPLGAVDAVEENYDEDREDGAQIEQVIIGEREVVARLQVFNAATTGAGSAISIMSAVQLALSLPSVRDALSAACASPHDRGSVQNLGALLGTAFDGRASLDVKFYTRETISEFTTWIERVEGTALGVPYSLQVEES